MYVVCCLHIFKAAPPSYLYQRGVHCVLVYCYLLLFHGVIFLITQNFISSLTIIISIHALGPMAAATQWPVALTLLHHPKYISHEYQAVLQMLCQRWSGSKGGCVLICCDSLQVWLQTGLGAVTFATGAIQLCLCNQLTCDVTMHHLHLNTHTPQSLPLFQFSIYTV